jgi:hypothetical protein
MKEELQEMLKNRITFLIKWWATCFLLLAIALAVLILT